MKKVLLVFSLVFVLSGLLNAEDISNSWMVGLHYPGISIRYNGTEKKSKEFRVAHKSGITLIGYRWYRNIGSYNKLNFFIAPEADLAGFLTEDGSNFGVGAALGIFGVMEYYFSEKWSFAADLGPAGAFVYGIDSKASANSLGIAVNFSLNWKFRSK